MANQVTKLLPQVYHKVTVRVNNLTQVFLSGFLRLEVTDRAVPPSEAGKNFVQNSGVVPWT